MKKVVRWLAMALAAVFLLAQFKQPDRTNPAVKSEIKAPAEIAAILERACYNCHSNETDWPWYSYVAPVSWWVADHVEHARRDLNFSDWPVLDFEKVEHAFHEIDEQISKGTMPLASYVRVHPEARLSDTDRDALRRWAKAND